MLTHRPKHLNSTEGLGVNTTKRIKYVTNNIGISIELWGELSEPWRQGETIIADVGYSWVTRWEVGKMYLINKFYDADKHLIGTYYDITRPVRRVHNGFECEDLYLDVWQEADKSPVLLDEDDLAAALMAGYITEEETDQAKELANQLLSSLKS